MLIALFVLLGLFIGSFLNVCIDRLPRGQSIVSPPSHCPSCNRKLDVYDLIPVLSYLWLRGRCRTCRTPIPRRLPVVEGVTGLLFGLLFWRIGLGLELAAFLVYSCILIVIFVVDLEQQLVLDVVSYPAMAAALVFSFFLDEPGVRGALEGGAAGALIMVLIYYGALLAFKREGLGFGDVKMAALMGLMLGFPLIVEALVLSWITGGLVAVLLILSRRKGRMDVIPTATFMAVSTIVTLLWGQDILKWYLG